MLPLQNLRALRDDMRKKGWTIDSFRFPFNGVNYIVLVILYLPGEKKDQYLYGDSGTGKTRSIYESHPAADICRITDYGTKGNIRFDAYHGQPVLVFEEFHSQIPIAAMLNYLDIYPLMLPARYNDRVACYTTVYITSNVPLDQQYPEIRKCKMETWRAFLRRIDTVLEFRRGGMIQEVIHEKN